MSPRSQAVLVGAAVFLSVAGLFLGMQACIDAVMPSSDEVSEGVERGLTQAWNEARVTTDDGAELRLADLGKGLQEFQAGLHQDGPELTDEDLRTAYESFERWVVSGRPNAPVLNELAHPSAPREWARWMTTLASAAKAHALAEQRARFAAAREAEEAASRRLLAAAPEDRQAREEDLAKARRRLADLGPMPSLTAREEREADLVMRWWQQIEAALRKLTTRGD